MIDYKRAALNAIEAEFNGTEVKGCFFHMSKCIWRHVQELGLQTTYQNDPELFFFCFFFFLLLDSCFWVKRKVFKLDIDCIVVIFQLNHFHRM